jgi:hypothetical protein
MQYEDDPRWRAGAGELAAVTAGWAGLDRLAAGAMGSARPGDRRFAALMWAGMVSACARDALGVAVAGAIPPASPAGPAGGGPERLAALARMLESRLCAAAGAASPGPARDALAAAASAAGEAGGILSDCVALARPRGGSRMPWRGRARAGRAAGPAGRARQASRGPAGP